MASLPRHDVRRRFVAVLGTTAVHAAGLGLLLHLGGAMAGPSPRPGHRPDHAALSAPAHAGASPHACARTPDCCIRAEPCPTDPCPAPGAPAPKPTAQAPEPRSVTPPRPLHRPSRSFARSRISSRDATRPSASSNARHPARTAYTARLWSHIAAHRPTGLPLTGSATVTFTLDRSGRVTGRVSPHRAASPCSTALPCAPCARHLRARLPSRLDRRRPPFLDRREFRAIGTKNGTGRRFRRRSLGKLREIRTSCAPARRTRCDRCCGSLR
jgi:protein TonB